MLKLFRQVRHQVLMENKSSKYFKYAFGEILLVVVGILIALQINNWNEGRRATNLETKLLKEVKAGLLSDLEDIKENIESHREIYMHQNAFIDWLESTSVDQDSVGIWAISSIRGTVFAASDSPYETLKQLGMQHISNDALRAQINKLYDIDFPMNLYWEGLYNEGFRQDLQKLYKMYFNQLDFEHGEMLIINVPAIKSDNEFLYALKSLKNFNNPYFNYRLPNAQKEIEYTLELLNKELNERK